MKAIPIEVSDGVLRLPAEVLNEVRLDRTSVQRIKKADVEDGSELLREAGSHAELVTGTAQSPWMGVVFNGEDGVRRAIESARSLALSARPADS